MNHNEYKQSMQKIASKHGKMARGAKYVNRWDYYWLEKNHVVETVDLTDVKTALDVGTGVGMLAYLLAEQGIQVEGSDIDEEITGPMFKECCELIDLKRHYLKIEPQKPMQVGNYDLFIATRTEFDRQFSSEEDWIYFINDAFKHFKKIFIKFNHANKGRPPYAPDCLVKYMWLARGLGKPRRAWYLQINREQWEQEIDKS